MYKLKIGRKGLKKVVEMETGVDTIAGYVEKPKPTPKFISKGQGKSPIGEIYYFLEDPGKLLKPGKTIILNGKALKVKEMGRKEGNPLTRITVKFI